MFRIFSKTPYLQRSVRVAVWLTTGGRLERELPFRLSMTFSDAIIIYLSCGSPFAVHALMTRDHRHLAPAIAVTVANFFAWPFTLVSMLYRLAIEKRSDQKFRRQNDTGLELKKLLTKIESVPHIGLQTITLFEFRNIFERYTGLAEAILETDNSAPVAGIFEITQHPAPMAASACFSRKAANKLRSHLAQARCDFIDAVAGFSAESRQTESIGSLAIETARTVGDTAGVRELERRFDPARKITAAYGTVDEVEQLWNTPEQSHPIAN